MRVFCFFGRGLHPGPALGSVVESGPRRVGSGPAASGPLSWPMTPAPPKLKSCVQTVRTNMNDELASVQALQVVQSNPCKISKTKARTGIFLSGFTAPVLSNRFRHHCHLSCANLFIRPPPFCIVLERDLHCPCKGTHPPQKKHVHHIAACHWRSCEPNAVQWRKSFGQEDLAWLTGLVSKQHIVQQTFVIHIP